MAPHPSSRTQSRLWITDHCGYLAMDSPSSDTGETGNPTIAERYTNKESANRGSNTEERKCTQGTRKPTETEGTGTGERETPFGIFSAREPDGGTLQTLR